MLKLGQMYNSIAQPQRAIIAKQTKTDADAVDTPKDTPNKTDLKTEKNEASYKQHTTFTRDTLFITGFTNKQIEMYFEKSKITNYSGEEKEVYFLKDDLIVNGQEIKSLQDLIDILNITPDTNKNERITLKEWLNKSETNPVNFGQMYNCFTAQQQ